MEQGRTSLTRLRTLTADIIRTLLESRVDPLKIASADEKPGAELQVDALGFSQAERRLQGAAEEVYRELTHDFETVFEHEKHHRLSLNLEDKWRNLLSLPSACLDRIDTMLNSRSKDLYDSARTLESARYTYAMFRENNSLEHRDPSYSKTPTFHYSVIAALIVIEAILNANYLAAGATLGLLGAILQSVSFSVINLMLAFLFGKAGVQYLGHVDISKQIFGGTMLLIFIIGLAGNLVIGHYVDALSTENDPISAAAYAFRHFVESPFNLSAINSAAIAATGGLFAFFYLIELLNIDDRYPGYRAVHIALSDARREVVKKREQIIAGITAVGEEILQESSSLSRKIRTDVADFKRSLESTQKLQDSFESVEALVLNVLRGSIQKYRARVFKHNTKAPQLLVGNPETLSLPSMKLNPQTADDLALIPRLNQQLEQLQETLLKKDEEIRQVTRGRRESFVRDFDNRTEGLTLNEEND